jgi:hypothetical protein
MNTHLLLPHVYKKAGWILFAPSCVYGFLDLFDFFIPPPFMGNRVFTLYEKGLSGSTQFFGLIEGNYLHHTIPGVLCLISLMMIAFSKEKIEDEFIWKTRMDSLLWAIYINYFVLIFCFIFFFGFEFLYVMVFNMFTILIIFIIRFNFLLYKEQKTVQHEK